MSIGSNLYLTYNQTIMPGTGSITLSNGAGDTRTIAITDTTQVTISGNTLKINPATDLVAGSAYGVSYPAGVIKDADGREAPALSSSTISLSTLPDILAPELASSLPSDDAAGVTGNHIVLTFNEPVKAGTGSIYISNGLGDLRNIAVSDITQVTISGKTVDINPSVDLIKGLIYNVQMASGVIKVSVWARHLDGRLSGEHHDAHGNCEGPTALAGADRHRASAVVHAPASSALAMRSDGEPASRRGTTSQRLAG
jgi:methionine-rich copper-binding protein CopC